MSELYYFAYGSNMSLSEIRTVCPSAVFKATACLPDHKLSFTRHSDRRQCGVADIVPTVGEHVWGILYKISLKELVHLDNKEGVPVAYDRCHKEVQVYEKNCTSYTWKTALSYQVVTKEMISLTPSTEYKNLLLQGTQQGQFPTEYVQFLNAIPTDESDCGTLRRPA